jgi:hypothetical protein
LVLSRATLFVAGPPDLVDEEKASKIYGDPRTQKMLAEQAEALAGKRGALLGVISSKTGKSAAELKLASPPVWDGMAAANKRLFVATMDGKLLCFGGAEGE